MCTPFKIQTSYKTKIDKEILSKTVITIKVNKFGLNKWINVKVTKRMPSSVSLPQQVCSRFQTTCVLC